MSNIVIIGSGPAGVSAALYAARAGVQTTVLTKGPGALDRAELIQNYYGFAEPITGAELERRGIEGAKAVGVEFVTTEAVGLTYTDKLTVETLAGDFPADAVILATGASRAAPRIPGLAGLEGHGVSYCATCDAFFYRGRDVAVLGSGEYALHEIQTLLPVAHSVTLLTGGAPLTAQFPPEVAVRTEAVEAILGEERVTGVQLKGGGTLEVSGVFVALGVAGSTALARKLGAEVNGSRIVVDDHMQTSLPGLYAAGDCTGGLLQVAKAVYEGALAGSEAGEIAGLRDLGGIELAVLILGGNGRACLHRIHGRFLCHRLFLGRLLCPGSFHHLGCGRSLGLGRSLFKGRGPCVTGSGLLGLALGVGLGSLFGLGGVLFSFLGELHVFDVERVLVVQNFVQHDDGGTGNSHSGSGTQNTEQSFHGEVLPV